MFIELAVSSVKHNVSSCLECKREVYKSLSEFWRAPIDRNTKRKTSTSQKVHMPVKSQKTKLMFSIFTADWVLQQDMVRKHWGMCTNKSERNHLTLLMRRRNTVLKTQNASNTSTGRKLEQ